MNTEQHEMFRAIGSAAPNRQVSWLTFAVLALALVWAGCGDDTRPPPPPSSRSKANKSRRARAGKAKAQKGSDLQFYKKIEDFAADEEEAKRLRHRFTAKDFEADITGEENRDPFYSYVVQQPGFTRQERGQTTTTANSKRCSSKNHVAPNYSLRDLRLVGIVLRGTRSYALFRDSASYGHIVRKGDCLGQEKARVAAIRTGFVSLEVIPEIGPNQQAKPPEAVPIQLYPEELTIEPSR